MGINIIAWRLEGAQGDYVELFDQLTGFDGNGHASQCANASRTGIGLRFGSDGDHLLQIDATGGNGLMDSARRVFHSSSSFFKSPGVASAGAGQDLQADNDFAMRGPGN